MTDKSNKLIETAIANGAIRTYSISDDVQDELIAFKNTDQLQATIDAVNATSIGDLIRRSDVVATNDRDMLLYLMQAFDSEVWNCEFCGHAEDCKDMDSAGSLREYLAINSMPAINASEGMKIYQCPRCATSMQVDESAKPTIADSIESADGATPVKPQYCWDREHEEYGFDSCMMDRHLKEHGLKEGDELEVEYSIAGKATYRLENDEAKLVKLNPAYFIAQPPSQSVNDALANMAGYSLVKTEVLNFLHGIGELEGVSFGDVITSHEGVKIGKYWWRKYLSEATLPPAPKNDALEQAANICDVIAEDKWALYKGTEPYNGNEDGRADTYVEGLSDGADMCANGIRALINTEKKGE